MATLADLVRAGAKPAELAALLDGTDALGRQEALAGLARSDFGPLFRAVAGQHVDLAYYVPKETPAGTFVRHVGLNSMPLFRTVDKRFVRAPNGELWGYNHLENPIASAFSGPGYFCVAERPAPSPDGRQGCDQLFIDYWRVPPSLPHPGWPAVTPNDRLPGSLVYGKMCDYMWRVSQHVSIGEAWRNGKSIDTYFIISREP